MTKTKTDRQAKYQEKLKPVLVRFNTTDAQELKLFTHLATQDNMSGYIKQLIKDDMDKK